MKFFIKAVVILMISVAVFALSGCGFYTYAQINDYNDFLANYEKYGKVNDQEIVAPRPDNIETIIGFKPLTDRHFSYGKPFNGNYTFVKLDNDNYILDSHGEFIPIEDDLSSVNLQFDKYVFADEHGLCGVKGIFGNLILPCAYDSIEIIGETILAVRGNEAQLYINNKLIGSRDFSNDVMLLSENYVSIDSVICNKDFTPMMIDGHEYVDLPSEEIVIVNMGQGKVGYYDLSANKRIGGEYWEANSFNEGVGVVRDYNDKTYIIDKFGNDLYSMSDIIIGNRYENYQCFRRNNFYGLINADFEIVVPPIFYRVKYERVLSGYLIVSYGNGEILYSLAEQDYVSEEFDNIEYANGLFICKNGVNCTVFDSDLNLLTICDNAVFTENILMVVKEGKYSYYIEEINE